MNWMIIDIFFMIAGIILIIASSYRNQRMDDDFLELFMCFMGFIFIAASIISESIRVRGW